MHGAKEFGQLLRSIREARRLTQEDLAGMIGRSVQSISAIEQGHSLPKIETLISICEHTGAPLSDLARVFDPNEPSDPDRLALETAIIERSRHLSMRDLQVLAKITQAMASEQ